MERQVPAEQELPRGLRHHRRVEAGAASGAGSFAESVVDERAGDDACRADARSADAAEEDRRADPVEAEAPGDDIRAATTASQR